MVTSGMFRLQGGVHANALSYYMEGYLQTPADHIKVNPYLDLDKLIVDGDVPPIYMITSVEDSSPTTPTNWHAFCTPGIRTMR